MNRLDPQPMTENGIWDDLVSQVLPKLVFVQATQEEMQAQREENKRQALLLAAAALRAAGEHTLAANLLD